MCEKYSNLKKHNVSTNAYEKIEQHSPHISRRCLTFIKYTYIHEIEIRLRTISIITTSIKRFTTHTSSQQRQFRDTVLIEEQI